MLFLTIDNFFKKIIEIQFRNKNEKDRLKEIKNKKPLKILFIEGKTPIFFIKESLKKYFCSR